MSPNGANDLSGLTSYHRPPSGMDAYILGSGPSSLSAAVYLLEEPKIPANRIHILETLSKAGGSTANIGDPVHGYEYRAEVMPTFSGAFFEDLLA